MEPRTHNALHLLVAAAFFICSMPSQATPKAAEHEDAPVTTGVDVAKPKLSVKPAKPQNAGKLRPVVKRKPVSAARPAKAPRAAQAR